MPPLVYGNNENMLLAEFIDGHGGKSAVENAAMVAGPEGDNTFGPRWRQGQVISINSLLNAWHREPNVVFDEAPPPGTPHRRLTWETVSAGYASGASYAIDLSTSLLPELRIDTGANWPAGCRMFNPYAKVMNLEWQPLAFHWLLRLADVGMQQLDFGLWHSTDYRVLFKRVDAAAEGAWTVLIVNGGAPIEYNTGIKTGTQRIWFCMDFYDGKAEFSIGTLDGEFPPGANVFRVRATWPIGAMPLGRDMTPVTRFQNMSGINRRLWLGWQRFKLH